MNQREISELLERIKKLEDRVLRLERMPQPTERKKPGPKPKNG